jgi:hypothetical protein
MHGALRQAAHPQQAFFHFIQVSFEMAFHGVLSFGALYAKLKRDSSLLSE